MSESQRKSRPPAQAPASSSTERDRSSAAPRGRLPWARLRRPSIVVAALVAGLAVVAGAVWLAPPAVAGRVIEPLLGLYAGHPSLPDELEPPAERSVVYDADGDELATLFRDENRVSVAVEEVSDHLRAAILATEDHRFAHHPGIHHRAIARAAWENWRADDVVEGGSTITQQLVQNVLLDDDQSLRRKAEEGYLALRLERRLDKDEILEAYLNQIYLGEGAYGVGTAAELYFSKGVGELDAGESATLAGMVRAPDGANPIADPDTARQRRDVVLQQMAAHGYLEDEDAEAAMEEPIDLEISPPEAPDEPFFVTAVIEELLDDERLGSDEAARRERLYTGGLEVHTTLDLDLQAQAHDALEAVLDDPELHPQASIVAVEPGDGAVRALAVGPREWGDCEGQDTAACPYTRVNPAVPGLGGAGRQPGSAFKPFVAVAALDQGVGPGWQDTGESEEPIPGCDPEDGEEEAWTPSNYDDVDAGVIEMAEAVADSNNVYHAKLGALAGLDDVVDAAERAGLRSGELTEDCAVALGAGSVYPIEMAAAYATVANDGQRCDPYQVASVADAQGEELYRHEPMCEEAFNAETSATLTALMRQVVEEGTGTRAAVDGTDVAGKTGTTQDSRDAWFAGYTGGDEPLTAAVWVGHEEPAPLEDIAGEATVTGGSLPADMFSRFMASAAEDRSTGDLEGRTPEDPVTVPGFAGGDIDEALEDAESVPSAGDPEQLLDADDIERTDADPEHHATQGHELHLVVYEASDWRPADEVLWQSVNEGAEVEAGAIVALAVSDGEGDPPEVPDVEGIDADEATAVLADAGYEVDTEAADVEAVVAPRDPEGFAEDQADPETDTIEEIEPPARLADLPDEFEVIDEPEADGGTVLSQEPGPGASLEPGELVTLEVARLQVRFEMPEIEPDPEEGEEPEEGEDPDEGEDGD